MTSTEEQQMLTSLSEISQDIRALLAPIKESTRQQGKAGEKAYGLLVNIARRR